MNSPRPLPIIALASSVYWPDANALRRLLARIADHLRTDSPGPLDIRLMHGAEEGALADLTSDAVVLMPLSGGVQPSLITLAKRFQHVALANAYLPDFLPAELGAELLHRNAHPACTDFFAHTRLAGRPARWIAKPGELHAYTRAVAAVRALRTARILRLGETEPWVINSTRDPARFRAALGCEIIPLPVEALYAEFAAVAADDPAVTALAGNWWDAAGQHAGLDLDAARRAHRVTVAMQRLLATHHADALAMACFAMIGALDTTSCLALSTLNDSARAIGACEGDLDAAVTLYLLKQLGADFVWIANPIIHPADCLDLAHCTAPRFACGEKLAYRLLRHHESGRGVAPEVRLPGNRAVTLARIGANLTELCVHPGYTESIAKQPTCHTQIRVHIPSSREFLNTLNGTHVVMSYGDWRDELAICADLLGLRQTGSAHLQPAATTIKPRPIPCCTC